jgi:hypothetical protein
MSQREIRVSPAYRFVAVDTVILVKGFFNRLSPF